MGTSCRSWDFCQIQYNYMDENSQAGRKGLEEAAEKGIPVIIMEPLRGGRLINMLPDSAKKIFEEPRHGDGEETWSPAEWGLRWLWNQKAVTVVLSGMNSLDMVEENCRIASAASAGCLTAEDQRVYDAVKAEINQTLKVLCTGCGYCMPCPHGVDIPIAFRAWNEMYSESKRSGRIDYIRDSILRHKPTSASLCVKCGRCERHCPQNIYVGVYMVINAPTRKELENNVTAFCSAAEGEGFHFEPVYWEQIEAFHTASPCGARFCDTMYPLLTQPLAAFTPFIVHELYQPGGIAYGVNQISRNILIGDRKTLLNGNGFILGLSGSGKGMENRVVQISSALLDAAAPLSSQALRAFR